MLWKTLRNVPMIAGEMVYNAGLSIFTSVFNPSSNNASVTLNTPNDHSNTMQLPPVVPETENWPAEIQHGESSYGMTGVYEQTALQEDAPEEEGQAAENPSRTLSTAARLPGPPLDTQETITRYPDLFKKSSGAKIWELPNAKDTIWEIRQFLKRAIDNDDLTRSTPRRIVIYIWSRSCYIDTHYRAIKVLLRDALNGRHMSSEAAARIVRIFYEWLFDDHHSRMIVNRSMVIPGTNEVYFGPREYEQAKEFADQLKGGKMPKDSVGKDMYNSYVDLLITVIHYEHQATRIVRKDDPITVDNDIMHKVLQHDRSHLYMFTRDD